MASLLSDFELFSSDAFWAILLGGLTAASCATVGSFLVVRRMSLMGDAIAHAVLPGLVLAFLFSGSLQTLPLLIGAAIAGLLTTMLTQWLNRYGGIPADASMGVVFTSLFAIGVILIKRYASDVHLDECVWQGSLLNLLIDTELIGGVEVPRHLFTIGPVFIFNLIVISLFWKEFKISSFDPGLSTTLGFQSGLLHYMMMVLVAITTVAAFEAVGSVLVVAMLIVPAATAHLLTDSLGKMVVIAIVVAFLSSAGGFYVSKWLDVEGAATMTVVAGGLYATTALFAPKYGIASQFVHNLEVAMRIRKEDVLAMLYRVEEFKTSKVITSSIASSAIGGGLLSWAAVNILLRQQRVLKTATGLELTDDGRIQAEKLVRSHRLWETYLYENLGLPKDHLHEPAERTEHFIGEQLVQELAEELKEKESDPHGREIPKKS